MIAVSARRSTTVLTTAVIGGLVAAGTLVAVPAAGAAPAARTEKVQICHRTNSVTNPYVSILVAQSSVDGNGGNDKGQGDHYLNHTGPVWTADTSKSADWGDIIPPIEGVHEGLNWNAWGQAIWTAGCRPAAVTDTDGDSTPDVVDTDDDGDTVPDAIDPDDDGDGVDDTTDPDSSTSTDSDGDTVPDAVDSDDDGNGIIDNAECEPKAVEPTTPESGPTEIPATRAACAEDGTVIPPVDDEADIDGDDIPNGADRDDDGDGIPDSVDEDQDGDNNPDATDPDDDGDSVPDATDPDTPVIEEGQGTRDDSDGDGTPDSQDRDDDGDGVPDTRDGDADGNGQPETKLLALTTDPLPASIEAGESTVLWDEELLTVLGTPARATVVCTPMIRSRIAPTGDVVGDVPGTSRSRLCEIERTADRAVVTVRGDVATIVAVRFTAPARGEFKALDERRTYRVIR